jgi:hypothetical protein
MPSFLLLAMQWDHATLLSEHQACSAKIHKKYYAALQNPQAKQTGQAQQIRIARGAYTWISPALVIVLISSSRRQKGLGQPCEEGCKGLEQLQRVSTASSSSAEHQPAGMVRKTGCTSVYEFSGVIPRTPLHHH